MINGIEDIFFAFVSCAKYQSRWGRIHSMCGRFGIQNYKIFFGGMDQYACYDNLIQLQVGDHYEDLPMKMFRIYQYAYNEFNYKYLWKIDDDVDLLNFNQDIISRLFHSINGHDYCGFKVLTKPGKRRWHCGKCSPDSFWNNEPYRGEYIPWAEGGRSYLLSRQATRLFQNIDNYEKERICAEEIYEDLAIAKYLKKHNIEPVEIFPWKYEDVIKKDLYL